MARAPETPGMARAKSTALSRSDRSFTKLQVAVAAASARPADEARTRAASALPKLSAWPTVAEEVQMPKGVDSGPIFIPIL